MALDLRLDHQDQITAAALHDYDFAYLFGVLEAHVDELGADRIASLEWSYLGALGHEPCVPTLSHQLAVSPGAFMELISSVYRAADEANQPTGAEDDDARARVATNAYSLLKAWNDPPGLVDGEMRADLLRQWVDEVDERLTPSGRLPHGMEHFGEVLIHTPSDSDDIWPGEVVRDFLEERQDEHIEMGIYLAIVNGRGVTSRGLEEGGAQEKALVAKYEADASKVADDAPRSATILRRVAESFKRDARQNDASAERFRTGLA